VCAVFYPIQKKERDKYTNVDGIYNRGVFFKMMEGERGRLVERKEK
jgi:hypothetical protein